MSLEQCTVSDTCKKYKQEECPLQKDEGFCLKLFKLTYLQNEALLTSAQRRKTDLYLDADERDRDAFVYLKKLENDAEKFVSEGRNLYITSTTTGNGKTSWALRILNAYFQKIWYKTGLCCRGLFISVPRFLLAIKDNISQRNDYVQHIKENVLTADLVIWDDIATKSFTVFEMENILSIIDRRVSDGKANIYTSNVANKDLKDCIGDRLYSRVFNTSTIIEFNGTDKRVLVK